MIVKIFITFTETKQIIMKTNTELDTSKLEAVEVDGIDMKDYPDFCDAYIDYAEIDGVELTDDQYEEVNEDSQLVYDYVMAKLF